MSTRTDLEAIIKIAQAALAALPATPAPAPVPAPPPAPAATGYTVKAGRIHGQDDQRIQIRGISHFGFNDPDLLPEYLWEQQWTEQLAQIKALGFNAVRCPFVPDTLYDQRKLGTPGFSYVRPEPKPGPDNDLLIGKTPLQALDLWMAECNRLGLFVLLDFHSSTPFALRQSWLVDNPAEFSITHNKQAYTRENWKRDLVFVADRYKGLKHFIGIDLYNEPYGKIRWAAGDKLMTDTAWYWKTAAEEAATAVLKANPSILVFAQGIGSPNFDGIEKPGVPINYGENFQPQRYQPLNIPAAKLVLSPHTYGPGVYAKSTFDAPNFPANLAADWETLFGQFHPKHAVCIGEWGGRMEGDAVWQNALVDYLLSKGMTDSFYWCYTPNSGDTGGILNDDLTVNKEKVALLKRLWGT